MFIHCAHLSTLKLVNIYEWKYHYVVLNSLVLNNQKISLALDMITVHKIRDINYVEFKIINRPESHFNGNLAYW